MIFVSGILFGLAAASCFSLAYLGSRLFYWRAGKSPFHLLVVSHLQMGILALLVLPFFWPDAPLTWRMLPPLLGMVACGMAGQLLFFLTLKRANPSQVTPLLALKILLLAFASLLILHKPISGLQWLSIGLCFTATFLINFSGQPIPLRGLGGIVATCACYALGDVCAALLIGQLAAAGAAHPAILTTCGLYVTAGSVGLLLAAFCWRDVMTVHVWRAASYFSVVYFLADTLLFTTFKLVGPVFGNILQSTRGIISILLAKVVARRGWYDLESAMTRAMLVRRLFAACLFTLAIACYVIGS
jgi:drug/metabolite transporter (DMT)-like permease